MCLHLTLALGAAWSQPWAMDGNAHKSGDTLSLTAPELLTLMNQIIGRIDMLWQRVLYSHAAIVGVMVFFATTSDLYAVPRLLVFFFYSVNSLIAHYSFKEAYDGLRAAVSDLDAIEGFRDGSEVGRWFTSRSFARHTVRRGLILTSVWVVVSYLLIYPLVPGLSGFGP